MSSYVTGKIYGNEKNGGRERKVYLFDDDYDAPARRSGGFGVREGEGKGGVEDEVGKGVDAGKGGGEVMSESGLKGLMTGGSGSGRERGDGMGVQGTAPDGAVGGTKSLSRGASRAEREMGDVSSYEVTDGVDSRSGGIHFEKQRKRAVLAHYGFEELRAPGEGVVGLKAILGSGATSLVLWDLFLGVPASYALTLLYKGLMVSMGYEDSLSALGLRVVYAGINISCILTRHKQLQDKATEQWDRYCKTQAEMWTEINKLISMDVEKARAWKLNQRHTSDYLPENIDLPQLAYSPDAHGMPTISAVVQNTPLQQHLPSNNSVAALAFEKLDGPRKLPEAFLTDISRSEEVQGMGPQGRGSEGREIGGFSLVGSHPMHGSLSQECQHTPGSPEMANAMSSPNLAKAPRSLKALGGGNSDCNISAEGDMQEIKRKPEPKKIELVDNSPLKDVDRSALKRKASEEMTSLVMKKLEMGGEEGVKAGGKKIPGRWKKLYRGPRDKSGEREWKPDGEEKEEREEDDDEDGGVGLEY